MEIALAPVEVGVLVPASSHTAQQGDELVLVGDLPAPVEPDQVLGEPQRGAKLCFVGDVIEFISDLMTLEPGDIIPVKGADGELHVLRVKGIFQSSSQLLTNDLVVMPVANWRKIFSIPENAATDLVTRIPNAREIDTVARKIQEHLPDARPISREQVLKTYEALFDWRSGVMIAAFAGLFF